MITGICGLIGRNLARALVAKGHEVYGIDLVAASGLPESVRYHQGDIADPGLGLDMLASMEGVIHLAGVSRVSEARANPELALKANVLGSTRLFQAVCHSARKPWIMLGSTREVDDLQRRGVFQSLQDIYALSKLAMESVASCYARESKSSLLILRFSDVYGDPEDQGKKLLPTFIRQAKAGLPLSIHGSSHGVNFYFTHIRDVTQAVVDGVNFLAAASEPVHAIQRVWDAGSPTDSRGLAEMILSISRSHAKIQNISVTRGQSQTDPAIQELPFLPTVSIAAGIQELLDNI